MSLYQLPPVIAGLKRCLQDDYIRASGNPLRRMNIIQEHARRFRLADADYRALAVEEARCAYQTDGGLPQGVYRNSQGDTFTVDDWGKVSGISNSAPPEPNSVWVPRFHRRTTGPVPAGYHFILGAWGWGELTPPPDSFLPYRTGTVPAGLEGARYLGAMPPMPQHLHSSTYVSCVPTDSVFAGQGSYLPAAATLQQPLAAAGSSLHPLALTVAERQRYLPFATANAQLYNVPVTAAPPGQQPPAFNAQVERGFEDGLQCSQQQCFSEQVGFEEPARQAPQLTDLEESVLDSIPLYPGYAPARGHRGLP